MSQSLPAPPPGPPAVRSAPLLSTLGSAGALAGFLIVLVYQLTLPTVEANRAARLDAAIHQVLNGIDRYETLYLVEGRLARTPPTRLSAKGAEKVYEGIDARGVRVGFAINAGPPGFADTIELLVGFNPSTHATLGLVILSSRETPGLGDKIQRETWLAQFRGALTPLNAVKSGASAKPHDVDMITGATISSRAVINGVNKAVERWAPIIEAYAEGGGS